MGFSIYFHIPYCRQICPYCDFNVWAIKPVPEEPYLTGMIAELQLHKQKGWHVGESVKTVFVGGGTPSLFSPKGLETLLQSTGDLWSIAPNAECTLEANPGTLDLKKLSAYRQSGWNRLSLGIQSFDDKNLKFLGRDHTEEEAIQALELAHKASFTNVSLDLIFGLKNQSLENWLQDIEKGISLKPSHISTYNLTIEERTIFYKQYQKGKFQLPEDDLQAEMLLEGRARLEKAGYETYEISNASKPGFQSRHNLNYWLGGDYLGVGAGAHSYSNHQRWWNIRNPKVYLQKIKEGALPLQETETLTPEQMIQEFLLTRLRLRKGISLDDFGNRFGSEQRELLEKRIQPFCQQGFFNLHSNQIALSPKGIPLLNELLIRLH